MNIFFLDANPYTSARWHGDKHVVKMVIETAQMLSTAHHLSESTLNLDALYKPTHANHPCSLWVRENTANYKWAWNLLQGLCFEFWVRRGKKHATGRLQIPLYTPPNIPPALEHTPPALAMPGVFKSDDPVAAYRRYYRQKFLDGVVSYEWSNERNEPDWIRK